VAAGFFLVDLLSNSKGGRDPALRNHRADGLFQTKNGRGKTRCFGARQPESSGSIGRLCLDLPRRKPAPEKFRDAGAEERTGLEEKGAELGHFSTIRRSTVSSGTYRFFLRNFAKPPGRNPAVLAFLKGRIGRKPPGENSWEKKRRARSDGHSWLGERADDRPDVSLECVAISILSGPERLGFDFFYRRHASVDRQVARSHPGRLPGLWKTPYEHD